MPNFAACTLKKSAIRKIEVYITDCKKTLQEVKAETGADYILNGTLYDMASHRVNCHLKASGAVMSKPVYTVYGYAWGIGPDISMQRLPCGSANYIACTPLIVDGKPLAKLTYDPGQGGKRGRTAIGTKGDRLAMYCTKDGTCAARTPEALRDDLAAAGWDSAVMLDGGTSSQACLDGMIVQSLDSKGRPRKVQHWICVWRQDAPDKSAPADGNDAKRERVLATARAEIGTTEAPAGSNRQKYGAWFGLNGYPWCMMFVQWVMATAGLPLPIKTASCNELANWARRHGQLIKKNYKPGDIVFMRFSGSAIQHVGFVESVRSGALVTIEGNTGAEDDANGGQVQRRTRRLACVVSAYRPWYNK